jgi:hypothetical protein
VVAVMYVDAEGVLQRDPVPGSARGAPAQASTSADASTAFRACTPPPKPVPREQGRGALATQKPVEEIRRVFASFQRYLYQPAA